MEQCADVFSTDRDVHPVGVLDSDTDTPTGPPSVASRKRRLTPYQDERLKLKRQEMEDKNKHRAELLGILRDIASKV